VPRPPRSLVSVAVLAATVIGLAGSSHGVPMPVTPAPDPTPDLTAEMQLPRLIRDPRTVAVLVTNHGTGPVWIREVELITASFAPTGPVEKGVTIAAGATKALAVVYGEGICGGEAAPPLAEATARLVVAAGNEEPAGDDRWQTLELPLAYAADRLGSRLHADCAAQLVAAAVDLRLERWSSDPDGRLRGVLVVERRPGNEPITVHKLTGSALYSLAVERHDGRIGRLPPGEVRLEAPVIADAARCDAHALADVKFPFQFRIWVTVGEATELPTTAAFDPADQAPFDQMWHIRCGV
jgi:hypothetical protein